MINIITAVIIITIFSYTIKKVLSNTSNEDLNWKLALLITILMQSAICIGILLFAILILKILQIKNITVYYYTVIVSFIISIGIASFLTIRILNKIIENRRWKKEIKNKNRKNERDKI